MFKKASILGLSALLAFYPTAGLAAEAADQNGEDQNNIQEDVATEHNSDEEVGIEEANADSEVVEEGTDLEPAELQREVVDENESATEKDEKTEEADALEEPDEPVTNETEDLETTDETSNENRQANGENEDETDESTTEEDSGNEEDADELLNEEENETPENEQLDEDLDLTDIYGAINQRFGTTIEYDFNKGYYILDLQAGLNNMSRNQVLKDKWVAFALPDGVALADKDVPSGVEAVLVNGKYGVAIKIPDVGEFPDSKYVYHKIPLVGKPDDNDPVYNVYLYNVNVDAGTYENIGQIKDTRNIDFSPMEDTLKLNIDTNMTGQATYDSDEGYYVLDLTVDATNHSAQGISSIYGAITLPEGVAVVDSVDGIVPLDNGSIAVKLPNLKAEENGEVTYQIPIFGSTTEIVTTSTNEAYTINGAYQIVGELNNSVHIDLSDMGEAWDFEAESQIVADYPGLDTGQLGLRFGFTTKNLTWDNVDRVKVEFQVPDAITIHEPDSYDSGSVPDSLKDLLGSDMSSGEQLDLTWNGNTAIIDLDSFEAGNGYGGFFTAFGETDSSLSDLEGLEVVVTLYQDGEVVAQELNVPFEIVSYEGNPVDPNEDSKEDETSQEDKLDVNDENKEDSTKEKDQLEITPINENENKNNNNDQNNDSKEAASNVDNNNGSGSSSTTSNSTKGAELPNTATNMYNILLIGSILTGAGASLFFIRKRKEISVNE